MSKHLISTVETYRVDTEAEAAELIEEAAPENKPPKKKEKKVVWMKWGL